VQNIIKPNCDSVDRATIFFMSISHKALEAARRKVAIPETSIKYNK